MARRTDFLVSCLPRDEDHTELRTVVIDLRNSCAEDKQAGGLEAHCFLRDLQ
ncbi:hypothetical protein AVEN_50444-1, partial [Araneus ventricosus]